MKEKIKKEHCAHFSHYVSTRIIAEIYINRGKIIIIKIVLELNRLDLTAKLTIG